MTKCLCSSVYLMLSKEELTRGKKTQTAAQRPQTWSANILQCQHDPFAFILGFGLVPFYETSVLQCFSQCTVV